MAAEIWRAVPGYEGCYEISDQGSLRSWLPWRDGSVPRALAPHPNNAGHLHIRLYGSGRRKDVSVHHLVLLAFVGPRPEGLETRHLNGQPTDNRLVNLAYGTRSENMLDRVRHGTNPNTRKTHCVHGHPFDAENTYRCSDGKRTCRACRRRRDAA